MFDNLRHFLLVVEHGSFTKAARHAHLSQPALSASIKKLEEAMDAQLLQRLPRGAQPTAAGTALIPHARAALSSVEAGGQAVRAVEGLEQGHVKIAAGATACTYLLPRVLSVFHLAYPNITLRLKQMWTPSIPEAVRAGEVDIGICQGEPGELPGELWGQDALCLVASPGLASGLSGGLGGGLGGGLAGGLAALPNGRLPAGTPLITFAPGAAMRGLSDRHLPQAEVVIELGSIAAVKGHCRAGLGVALLSRLAVETDLGMGRLVALQESSLPPARQLSLVHRGLQRLSPAARAMLEVLRESRP